MELVLKHLGIPKLRAFLRWRDQEKVVPFMQKHWPRRITANMVTGARFPLLIPIYF